MSSEQSNNLFTGPRIFIITASLLLAGGVIWRSLPDSTRDIPQIQKTVPASEIHTSDLTSPSSFDLKAHVEVVYDGDSLKLTDGSDVRLIGIDAPEKNEPFADSARRQLRNWIKPGDKIGMIFGKNRTDRYERLLAYVYLLPEEANIKRPLFVNSELVRLGLAYAYIHSDNEGKKTELIAAQREAVHQRRGLFQSPEGDERYYLRFTKRYRFHRPDCPMFEEMDMDSNKLAQPEKHNWIQKYKTRPDALLDGLSPCRECNP